MITIFTYFGLVKSFLWNLILLSSIILYRYIIYAYCICIFWFVFVARSQTMPVAPASARSALSRRSTESNFMTLYVKPRKEQFFYWNLNFFNALMASSLNELKFQNQNSLLSLFIGLHKLLYYVGNVVLIKFTYKICTCSLISNSVSEVSSPFPCLCNNCKWKSEITKP